MKEFIEHIQKSIYGPEYYRALLDKPASFSWKYYWSFTMLLAMIMTVVISLPLVPEIDHAVALLSPRVLAYYPPDLEITVVNGEVRVNKPEPYTLPLPESFTLPPELKGDTALLVIDTSHEITLEAFTDHHTLFWLSKDALITLDRGGSLSVIRFVHDMNLTVNRAWIQSILSKIDPLTAFVAPVLVLMIFLAFLVSFAVLLIYLLLNAVFILGLGRMLGRHWSYGESYRIGLHAVTFPLLCSSAFSLLPIANVSLPFFTSILTLLVVYVNFKNKILPNPAPVKREGEEA